MEAGQELKFKNNEIALQLREIYRLDQNLRSQSKELEKAFGFNSKEMKNHWQSISVQDSLNLIKVGRILDEKGWLSAEEVSDEGNAALFLVIQHSNLEVQLNYLPLLRKAVKEGKASGQDLALMEDRVALAQGQKQIYGSQIYRNPENGEHYLAPLIKPNEVNDRRKKIGLMPIEDYLLHWNLNWKSELSKLRELK